MGAGNLMWLVTGEARERGGWDEEFLIGRRLA
jgi:hypothetical protein